MSTRGTPTLLGKLTNLGLTSALVLGGLLVVAPTAASAAVAAAPQACAGPIGATTVADGITVAAGAHCDLTGTTVNGPITVSADGWLTGTGVTVNGALSGTNVYGISLEDSEITGAVNISATGTNWEVGYFYFIDSAAKAGITVTGGVDVELTDSIITGAVSTTGANYTDISGGSISTDLTVGTNKYGTYLCDLDVTGNVTLTGNKYQVAAFAGTADAACYNTSTVGGTLALTGNTAAATVGLVEVEGNINLATNTPLVSFGRSASLCGDLVGDYAGEGPYVGLCDDGAEAKDWNNYQKVLLTKNIGEPIDMAILPDGRILHTARNGAVRMTDPALGTTNTINNIPVYANSEDGLQTIGISPTFATDNWVYVYYAPSGGLSGTAPTNLPAGADDATYWNQWMGVNRLSRFKWTGSALNLATEQTVIEVPVNRGQCCHVGGDFDWDDEGNLYLATGDNTPAGAPGANGYAPNNDATGINPGNDARRGAGNTNDLRGKILRIKPNASTAGYTVPAGNMFAAGTAKTKPEIFVMGVRNPFRIDVDGPTNSLTWGDYGPDAGGASAQRGPMGYVEWNSVSLDTPTNSGWPYCTADNKAYNEWNYNTSTQGAFFNCTALKNNSRWNTGLVDLPAASPATLYYGDNPGEQPWNELVNFGGGGQGPHGGPVYHYDPENPSGLKFPAYWDNKAFFGEFSQDYLATFTLNWPNGPVSKIENFLPNSHLASVVQPLHDNPMDMEFGPDGALYVLEYGDGFFTANPDAGLYQISYTEGNQAPVAAFTATPISSSTAPLTVNFNAAGSADPEGGALTYQWDFDGNGTYDGAGVTATHTYTALGQVTARLKVTDPEGRTGVISVKITVGNQAPVVTVTTPGNGSFFDWGQAVPFSVTTADPEDGGNTVCSRVSWTFGLGHAEHAHPESIGTGCTGAWPTPIDAPEHGETEKIYGAVVVKYTDGGHNGVPGAEGEATLILNPKLQQAEHASSNSGVSVIVDPAANGTGAITGLAPNDFLKYDVVNFAGITGVTVAAKGTGSLQMRWGTATATPFATVPITGATWNNATHTFGTLPTGSGALYITATGSIDVDALTFIGAGVADVTNPTITHVLTPATGTGTGGAYTEAVSLKLNATDNAGIEKIEYSTNGGNSWIAVAPVAGVYPPIVFSTGGARVITYRATDISGNTATGTVSFTIDLPTCDPSDEFDGTSLNTTCRWTTIVGSNPANVSVSGGELKVVTELGEFNNASTDGKNLILQDAPAGDWTMEMKFKATMIHQYQQAVLMAWADNNNFVKTGVLAKNVPSAALNLESEIVAETAGVFGTGGNRQFNIAEVSSTGSWYLRMVKSGSSYTGFVSQDGITWSSMGAAVTQATPMTKVGLQILGPVQTAAVTVPVDYFRITPAADTTAPTTSGTVSAADPAVVTLTATDTGSGVNEIKYRIGTTGAFLTYTAPVSVPRTAVAQTVEYFATDIAGNIAATKTLTVPAAVAGACPRNDEFDGTSLNTTCRWTTIVGGTPANVSVSGGELKVVTEAGEFNNALVTGKNLILQDAPAGDWTIEMKVKSALIQQYQQAVLMAYADNNNFVKTGILAKNTAATALSLGSEIVAETGGVFGTGGNRQFDIPETSSTGNWYLRMTKSGNNYTGFVSQDGITWSSMGAAVVQATPMTKLGLHLLGPGQVTPVTVPVDYWRITVVDTTAPTTSGTVSAADPAIVTLSATDAGAGVKEIKYRLGTTGAFLTYTNPVSVPKTAVAQTIEYYAVDYNDNTAATKTLTVPAADPPADTTAPTTSGTVSAANPAVVTLTASDAGSGVKEIRYRIGTTGTFLVYTAPVSVPKTAVAQTVEYYAVDNANNTAATKTLTVPAAPPTCPGAERGPNDQFTGTTLDTCRWTVINADPALASVVDGSWKVTTTSADIYQAGNDVVPNIITTTQPTGDWVVETKVKIDTALMYQQGGIIVFKDVDNFVRLSAQARADNGSVYVDLGSEVAAVNAGNSRSAELPQTADDTYLLRLARTGNVYTGSYSVNGGSSWVTLAGTWTNAAVSTGEVGLYALGKNAASPTTAFFDYIVQRAAAAPTTSANVAPAAPASGWYNGPVTVTVSATGQLPGTLTTESKVDSGAWTAYTAPVVVTADGNHTVSYRSTQDGQVSAVKDVTFKIDATKPQATLSVAPAAPTSGWHTGPVTVAATATDSSDAAPVIEVDAGAGWVGYTAALMIDGDGTHPIKVRATDVAGNVSEVQTVTVKIDTAAPVSNATVDEQARTVTVTGADSASGVDRIEVRIGDADWTAYTGPVQVPGTDAATVSYRAVDKAGNVEQEHTASVPTTGVVLKDSTTLAAIGGSWQYGSNGVVNIRVSGPGGTPSGDVEVRFDDQVVGTATLANGRAAITPTGLLPAGTHTLEVVYTGDPAFAGSTDNVDVSVAKASSQTTATLAKATTRYGSSAVIAVKVTAADLVPQGKVTVKSGTTTVATGMLVNGEATFTLSRTLSVKVHNLTVSYAGDDNVAASSAATTLTVLKATSKIAAVKPPVTLGKTSTVKVRLVVPTEPSVVAAGDAAWKVTLNGVTKVSGTAKIRGSAGAFNLPALKVVGKYLVSVNYSGTSTVDISKTSFTVTVK